jgi:hypothetical protein
MLEKHPVGSSGDLHAVPDLPLANKDRHIAQEVEHER